MNLSGWMRLWIVGCLLWWTAAGIWAALTLGPEINYTPATINSEYLPTPLTQEWLDTHYGPSSGTYVADYWPLFWPVAIIVAAPIVLALVLRLAVDVARWVRSGFDASSQHGNRIGAASAKGTPDTFTQTPSVPQTEHSRSVAASEAAQQASTHSAVPEQVVFGNFHLEKPDKEPSPATAAAIPTKKAKPSGAATYVVTFIVASILVNGFTGAAVWPLAQGISISASWTQLIQFTAIGAAIHIVGFTIVYGISRSLTRMVPLKAAPWILGSVLVGNLLAMGQVYGVARDALGIGESRLLALQVGGIGVMGGIVAWAAFCAIFRNQS